MQAAYCFRPLDCVTAIYWYIAVFSLQERCRSISLVTGAPKSVTPRGHTSLEGTRYRNRSTEIYTGSAFWITQPNLLLKAGTHSTFTAESWQASKDGDVTALLGYLFMFDQSRLFFLVRPSLAACESVISCFTPVHLRERSGSVSVIPYLF